VHGLKNTHHTRIMLPGGTSDQPRVSNNNIERMREAFQRSPRKSVARASRELFTT
jgi:hypothetical protein